MEGPACTQHRETPLTGVLPARASNTRTDTRIFLQVLYLEEINQPLPIPLPPMGWAGTKVPQWQEVGESWDVS